MIGLSYRRDECANIYNKSYPGTVHGEMVKYYENTKTSSDTLFHTKTVLQSKSKDGTHLSQGENAQGENGSPCMYPAIRLFSDSYINS